MPGNGNIPGCDCPMNCCVAILIQLVAAHKVVPHTQLSCCTSERLDIGSDSLQTNRHNYY